MLYVCIHVYVNNFFFKDADVQLSSSTITFDPKTFEQTLTLRAIDDDIYEGTESVNLEVVPVSALTEAVPQFLTVTIEDNDCE